MKDVNDSFVYDYLPLLLTFLCSDIKPPRNPSLSPSPALSFDLGFITQIHPLIRYPLFCIFQSFVSNNVSILIQLLSSVSLLTKDF